MCMEDIRLGREKRTAIFVRNPSAGAAVPLVGSNSRRTHLTIMWSFGTGSFGTSDMDVAGGNSIALTSAAFRHDFDIERHGDIVTKGWTIVGPGAGVVAIVIETFLDKQ